LRVAVGAADKIYVLYHAVDDVSFVEGEALVFPEVGIDNAFPDGLFEDRSGIETVGS